MKFKNPFRKEVKSSASAKLLVPFGVREAKFTPRQYDQLATEGYQKNVVAYRCISLVSRNAAGVPWVVFRGKGANRERLHEHPLIDLLNKPNPQQGGAALFEAAFGFYLIAGNSYIEAAGPKNAAPLELWTLRPDRMRIVPGAAGLPTAYRYQVNGTTFDYAADTLTGQSQVLHMKSFHPLDDWYGMSPMEAAAFSIDQHNEAAKWNAALLQSSGRPSGALVYKPAHPEALDTLTGDQRDTLKTEIEQYFSGSGNAGRPMVLEGGLDWREIALAFHVPPQLIGIEGSLTFANFEQARLALFDDAVLPLLDHMRDSLNNWLSPRFGDDISIGYDADAIEALAPRREKTWSRLAGCDFMTVNEKRQALGMSPLAGGDVIGGGAA